MKWHVDLYLEHPGTKEHIVFLAAKNDVSLVVLSSTKDHKEGEHVVLEVIGEDKPMFIFATTMLLDLFQPGRN